jgi:hypothetical protein
MNLSGAGRKAALVRVSLLGVPGPRSPSRWEWRARRPATPFISGAGACPNGEIRCVYGQMQSVPPSPHAVPDGQYFGITGSEGVPS